MIDDLKAFLGMQLIDITLTDDGLTLLFEDESNNCSLVVSSVVGWDCNNPLGE